MIQLHAERLQLVEMTTKLPGRSLSKNWLKVQHIMRFGRVVKHNTKELVHEVGLQFEPEISKNFAQVCLSACLCLCVSLSRASSLGLTQCV